VTVPPPVRVFPPPKRRAEDLYPQHLKYLNGRGLSLVDALSSRWGVRSADTGKFDTVVARLDPLSMPDRPFHASVTELQALAAARKNDLKRARELWTAIVKDPASPQGAQQRAQAMLTYYGPGEGK